MPKRSKPKPGWCVVFNVGGVPGCIHETRKEAVECNEQFNPDCHNVVRYIPTPEGKRRGKKT